MILGVPRPGGRRSSLQAVPRRGRRTASLQWTDRRLDSLLRGAHRRVEVSAELGQHDRRRGIDVLGRDADGSGDLQVVRSWARAEQLEQEAIVVVEMRVFGRRAVERYGRRVRAVVRGK